MYEYILHCFKTTYKYFAVPLNTAPRAKVKTLNKEILSDFTQLSVQSQHEELPNPEDSDCIIEEEEEVEEYSDSDEERGKEKVDLGKSSFSEDEEDEYVDDVDTCNRHHLDSFTTEEEGIFPVDEISGEELLSDEECPDLDTPGSLDEDHDNEVELAPVTNLNPQFNDTVGDENKTPKQKKVSYEFTKQAFTKGKVGIFGFTPKIIYENLLKLRLNHVA